MVKFTQNISKEIINEIKKTHFYRQAGEGKLAYAMLPYPACFSMMKDAGVNYNIVVGYIKGNDMEWLWDKDAMIKVSKHYLNQQIKNPKFIDTLEKKWWHSIDAVKKIESKILSKDLDVLDLDDLVSLFKELTQKGVEMWNHVLL